MIRKILSFILICTLALSLTNFAYGSSYLKLDGGQYVYVEDVIDADSFLVSVDGKEALVKIVGVDINGYTRSKEVMESMLLSKFCYFRKANYSRDDRWSYGNLIYNEIDIAKFMIENGLATVNEKNITDSDALVYNKLEENAQKSGYNFWERNTNYENIVSSEAININMATSAQLIEALGVTEDLAYEIINYRKYNPFNNYLEVKFVPDMTTKIFDKIKNRFVVATNINTANQRELESIEGISSSEASKIINSRGGKAFTATTFKELNYLTDAQYERVKPFLYYSGVVTIIDYNIPNKIININTATTSQITEIGISSSIASTIYKSTYDSDYVYHNIGELSELSRVSDAFGEYNDFKYADNINFVTNINTATKNEIESLYGEYASDYKNQIATLFSNSNYKKFSDISEYFPNEIRNKVENVIVFDDDETDYINLNTATVDDLKKLGLTSNVITNIINDRKIYKYSEITKDISNYANKISLYTNVNTASSDEIQRLSTALTDREVSSFISYRDKELFGTIDEVREFFKDLDKEDVYTDFKNFITVR